MPKHYIILTATTKEYAENYANASKRVHLRRRDTVRAEAVTFPDEDNVLEDLLKQQEAK